MCAHVCRDSVTEALLKDFSKEADWLKTAFYWLCATVQLTCAAKQLKLQRDTTHSNLPQMQMTKWNDKQFREYEKKWWKTEKMQNKIKFLSTNQACPKSPSATTIYSSYRAIKYIFNIIPLRILWITSYCCLEKRLSHFSCCDQIISTWFIRDRVF